MNRRNFLGAMVGGIATAAAVRTWPFRVYSFPSTIGDYPDYVSLPEGLFADIMVGDTWFIHPDQLEAFQEIMCFNTKGESRGEFRVTKIDALRNSMTIAMIHREAKWNNLLRKP